MSPHQSAQESNRAAREAGWFGDGGRINPNFKPWDHMGNESQKRVPVKGMTPIRWNMLACLLDGKKTRAEICDRVQGTDYTTVRRAIHRMGEMGLLTYQTDKTASGWGIVATITDAGREAMETNG